jgi:hypothetical protein
MPSILCLARTLQTLFTTVANELAHEGESTSARVGTGGWPRIVPAPTTDPFAPRPSVSLQDGG